MCGEWPQSGAQGPWLEEEQLEETNDDKGEKPTGKEQGEQKPAGFFFFFFLKGEKVEVP